MGACETLCAALGDSLINRERGNAAPIVDFAVYADFCLAGKHRGKLVLYGEHSRERLLLPYLCPQQFRTKPCIGENCGKFAP